MDYVKILTEIENSKELTDMGKLQMRLLLDIVDSLRAMATRTGKQIP